MLYGEISAVSIKIGPATAWSGSEDQSRHGILFFFGYLASILTFACFLFLAHGIMSPIEEERWLLAEKLLAKDTELTINASNKSRNNMFMDECEILDWDFTDPEQKSSTGRREQPTSSNSHKSVEMASDQKTPLRMRGGDFGMFPF